MSAPPPPGPAQVPPPPSLPGPRPPRPGARPSVGPRILQAVAVVLVVILVVVSGLYLADLLPFGPKATAASAPAGGVTFVSAEATGSAFVRDYQGGGWELLGAGALVSPATLTVPFQENGTILGSCTFRAAAGVTEITAPGSSDGTTSGAATAWELVYAGGPGGLVVSVVNGSASASATISGNSSCTDLLSLLSPIPSNLADSSTVVQAVDAAGGSAFLAAHPGANLSMTVWGGASAFLYTVPPIWHVAYSMCSLGARSPQPEPVFAANVSASGAVASSSLTYGNCSSATGLGGLTGGFGLSSLVRAGPSLLPTATMAARPTGR